LSGVEVLDVSADTPAQRLLGATDGRAYTLVPNRDIITQVNGVPVDTAEACQAEIARSPDRMALRVYDTATDSFSDYAVDLGTTSLVAQSGDAP
jgi:S1-C subfamily serine protease